MKVIEDSDHDRLGRYPLIFKGAKDIREVYEWLFHHYQGYKFGIVIDVSHDEWEDLGKDIYVYFLDDILEEAAHYSDAEIWRDGKKIFPKNGGA